MQTERVRREGFAIVLGGGGGDAAASCCGALRALAEVGGLHANDADVVIGTSAGAVIAADLRLGRTYEEILAGLDVESESNHSGRITPAWQSVPDLFRRVVGSTWIVARSSLPMAMRTSEPPSLLRRAFPGSLMQIAEEHWTTRFPAAWPDRELWTVASDLESGERVVLSSTSPKGSAVTLTKAVQASCAVPGVYAPVRIGGRRLIDGGVHSSTNLDLAVRTRCSAVIALAPMGFDPHSPPDYMRSVARLQFNAQVEREAEMVRRAGMRLMTLRPSSDELRHHGHNILSRRGSDRVARAAYDATAARLSSPAGARALQRIKARLRTGSR